MRRCQGCPVGPGPDGGNAAVDEEYQQNKAWIAAVLQVAYLVLMCMVLPYAFLWWPFPADPRERPLQIFCCCAAGCTLAFCALHWATGRLELLYLPIIAYGVAFPYTCWAYSSSYVATSPEVWNWLMLSMVLTLLLVSPRWAFCILLLQIATPVAGGLADAYGRPGLDVPLLVGRAFSLVFPSCFLFGVLLFFAQFLTFSRKQAELKQALGQSLLRNILPLPVADELMGELAHTARVHIAHDYLAATVCFCDIVGFTKLCLSIDSGTLVHMLNDVFTYFDQLCLVHGVEKIKTIGDAYMFAGFPATDESPEAAAVAVVTVAVGMVSHMADFTIRGLKLQVRAGAHSGPVVAGVIGCTKFVYDIWGPTVNLASRLESSGMPGEVQVSTATRDLIAARIPCTFRASLDLKGAGAHDVHLVEKGRVPLTQSPGNLGAMGLGDLAKLVQEINRRQSQYAFTHRVRVSPFDLVDRPASPSRSLRRPPSPAVRAAPPAPSFAAGRSRSFTGCVVRDEAPPAGDGPAPRPPPIRPVPRSDDGGPVLGAPTVSFRPRPIRHRSSLVAASMGQPVAGREPLTSIVVSDDCGVTVTQSPLTPHALALLPDAGAPGLTDSPAGSEGVREPSADSRPAALPPDAAGDLAAMAKPNLFLARRPSPALCVPAFALHNPLALSPAIRAASPDSSSSSSSSAERTPPGVVGPDRGEDTPSAPPSVRHAAFRPSFRFGLPPPEAANAPDAEDITGVERQRTDDSAASSPRTLLQRLRESGQHLLHRLGASPAPAPPPPRRGAAGAAQPAARSDSGFGAGVPFDPVARPSLGPDCSAALVGRRPSDASASTPRGRHRLRSITEVHIDDLRGRLLPPFMRKSSLGGPQHRGAG